MGKLKITSKSPIFCILFLFLAASLCGCTSETPLLINEEIKVTLPQWPSSVKETVELSGWQISIKGKYINQDFFLSCDSEETPDPHVFSISIPKNKHFSIKADPVTKSGDKTSETLFFMPAGSVYPDLYTDSGLILTFEDGFTAYIMSLLETEEFSYGDHFNWQKFSQTIKTRSADELTFYNPWNLNIQKITHGIRTGNFSSTLLNHPKLQIIQAPETFQVLLSAYIPLNCRVSDLSQIHVLDSNKTYFMTSADTVLIIDTRITNKLSHTTVFTPKFIHRDSVCKKE